MTINFNEPWDGTMFIFFNKKHLIVEAQPSKKVIKGYSITFKINNEVYESYESIVYETELETD